MILLLLLLFLLLLLLIFTPINYLLFAIYNQYFVSFLQGCVVGGVAGDGTAQGTCATATDVCTAAGECLGTYSHDIIISIITIISI